MLVLTIGDAVHGFTLDSALGEFVLTHPSITAGRCRLT
jgi:fructose-1,6-bisphosphatase I